MPTLLEIKKSKAAIAEEVNGIFAEKGEELSVEHENVATLSAGLAELVTDRMKLDMLSKVHPNKNQVQILTTTNSSGIRFSLSLGLGDASGIVYLGEQVDNIGSRTIVQSYTLSNLSRLVADSSFDLKRHGILEVLGTKIEGGPLKLIKVFANTTGPINKVDLSRAGVVPRRQTPPTLEEVIMANKDVANAFSKEALLSGVREALNPQ